MNIVSVRFTPAMITSVRHFARKDGITVSRWVRKVIERELRMRQPAAVDVSSYPMPVTTSAGADVKVTYSLGRASVTGNGWAS